MSDLLNILPESSGTHGPYQARRDIELPSQLRVIEGAASDHPHEIGVEFDLRLKSDVLTGRSDLKMIRVDATRHPALVMNVSTGRDSALRSHVRDAMRPDTSLVLTVLGPVVDDVPVGLGFFDGDPARRLVTSIFNRVTTLRQIVIAKKARRLWKWIAASASAKPVFSSGFHVDSIIPERG